MSEPQNETIDEIEASAIDLDFVARARPGIEAVELDGELLLSDEESGLVHVLNPVGSIVWKCLDGSSDLRALIDDLADAFDTPADVVRDDVLSMVRSVGSMGLLEGVAKYQYVAPATPAGAEVGTELAHFELSDLDGNRVDTRTWAGQQTLLVNWSPQCGYCVNIAADLGAAVSGLAEHGVRLVLLAAGDLDTNRALVAEHGLTATVLLRADAEFDDPFPAMGTPVAYLLDAEGRVAAPLAYGAADVPALVAFAQGMAPEVVDDHDGHDHDDHDGHDHDHDGHGAKPEGGPRYVPTGGGVCGPGAGGAAKPARIWARTSAYAVGEFHLGIRADSGRTDEILGRVFSAHRLPDGTEAPDNFSVVLGDGGERGSRGLNLLLQNTSTVVRSRSPRRVIAALATYLSAYVPTESADDDTLIRVSAVGAIVGDDAVILPASTVTWLEQVQSRLNRAGFRLVDAPYATVDTATNELVVPAPLVEVDWDALAAVDDPGTGRSELPRVEPGRYPLKAWGVWDDGTNDTFTPARAVAAGMAALHGAGSLGEGIQRLITLFDEVSPVPLPYRDADSLVEAVGDRIGPLV